MKTKQAKLIIRSPVGTFFRYVEIEDCAESSFEYVRDFLLITKSVSALDENGAKKFCQSLAMRS